ncbi:MAG: site-specific recombinase [Gammaproteobacteria bacterium]
MHTDRRPFFRSLWSRSGRGEARALKRLDELAARLTGAGGDERLAALGALVAWLRPRRAGDVDAAKSRLALLTQRMREDAAARAALRNTLLWLILEKQPLRLLSDSGVLAGEGFFSALWRRGTHGLLPDELDPAQLKDVVSLLFTHNDDYVWVEGIAETDWVAFLDALDFGAAAGGQSRPPFQILEALLVVSYRIAALGLEPELVRNHPSIERYESPFLTQNVEMRQFIDERRAAATDKREPAIDDKHLLVLLGQCEQIIAKVRKQAAQTGASVSLTVLLARLAQNIARLKLLLQLLEKRPAHELNELRVRFFQQVVRAENTRHSVRELWAQTADLLSVRIVSNASKAGEQYITSGRADFFRLFRSAMGAGFIVVGASLAKLALMDPGRSPFGEAIVYSAVYAAAFVLMYVFNFSLATKQPAMTANAIAQTLEGDGTKKRLDALAELVVRTFRSQFIALVGNLIVVVPLAIFVAQLVWMRTGAHYIDSDKAQRLLADVYPFSPHVWIWAALTGIALFATGLISGYYDNKAVYDRVPQRVAQARWLQRLLGRRGAERLAGYVENNLGGLVGSVFFGIMLGSTGAIGRIFGLPIDTLHVTFTSANSAYAVAALDASADLRGLLLIVGGVAVIGLLNLFVSFTLALYVAMRAQRVYFDAGRALLKEVALRFARRPRDFFWPPRDALS